jgi:hypothetical protein
MTAMVEDMYTDHWDEVQTPKFFADMKAKYERQFKDRAITALREVVAALPHEEQHGPYYENGSFDNSELARQASNPSQPDDIVQTGDWLGILPERFANPTVPMGHGWPFDR